MNNEKITKLQNLFGQAWELDVKATNIAGAIGEEMVIERVGGEMAKFNQPGFDITANDGTKHQVKTRVFYGEDQQSGTTDSFLFSVSPNDWDVLDMLVLDVKGNPIRQASLTREQVEKVASTTKSGKFNLTFAVLDKAAL